MYSETTRFVAPQESKGWNVGMVAMAAVCGCIGAASIAHYVTAPTQLYAPVATQVSSQVATGVAPMTHRAAEARVPAGVYQQAQVQNTVQDVEAAPATFAAPQASWAPLMGLLAIPVGIVALMMRRKTEDDVEAGFGPAHAAGVAGAFAAAAQPAMAAQEVAQVADNRITALAALLIPAIGWVGFNVLGPATRQLDEMSEKAASNQARAPRAAPKRKGRR